MKLRSASLDDIFLELLYVCDMKGARGLRWAAERSYRWLRAAYLRALRWLNRNRP